MEDEMLRIRICAAGAATAVFLTAMTFLAAMTSVSGAAVPHGGDQPGKPAVLAGLTPPHEAPQQKKTMAHAKAHAKTAHKTTAVKSVKMRTAALAATVTAKQAVVAKETMDAPPPASALPENVWQAPERPVQTEATAAPTPAPIAENASPRAVVVDGQTVQIAAPEDVNEIDLAAADQPKDNMTAEPAPTVVAAAHEDKNQVGSASWIAQVLAALGGAIAAGSVAWFLIGASPQRMYG